MQLWQRDYEKEGFEWNSLYANNNFNEEAYEQNSAILRTDIYYLELQKQETVINGKKTDTIQKTQYALFFYNANTDKCEGMNLNTQNLAYFTKVK